VRRFFASTRFWRRTVQILCLAGFLWLFLQTEYRGQDHLPYPVSLLFRIDPLAALAAALAPGAFVWKLLWPALVVLGLTALFGRFFCGWICPLGTTLDGCGKLCGRGRKRLGPGWRRSKYYLLLFMAVAAAAGVQLLGLLDPLSLFLRSLTLSFYPAFNLLANNTFDFFYNHRWPIAAPLADAVYPFSRDYLLAFHPPGFLLALLTLLVFVGIILLERVEHRFWCRNLCPLGALLGLSARFAILRRQPAGSCSDCRKCGTHCRTGAFGEAGGGDQECVRCWDCQDYCPDGRVRFVWQLPRQRQQGIDLQRRGVVGSLALGALIAPVAATTPALARRHPFLLRPPGAVAEEEFLRRCIRCGECMKVCIGQALHPALNEAGMVGLWSPLLVPRIGYCEYNCTLCGQVCPTGAIRLLSLEEKKRTVIGLAVIDRNRCLPYAAAEECLVCEEHCPTGKKAIVFTPAATPTRDGRPLKLPQVVKGLCIGCGICETKCPLEGQSAIIVVNEGESRRPRQLWS